MSCQVVSWDFRANHENYSVESLQKALNAIAKEWVFQLEKGKENGYKHWQGRCRLKVKSTKSALLAKLSGANYLAPTSKGVHTLKDFNYVLKDDTRIEGPWKSIDAINALDRKGRPPLRPDWVGMFNIDRSNAYPYQLTIADSGDKPDDRCIDVVIDDKGCIGKSHVGDMIIREGLGIEIPATIGSADDIMKMLYCELHQDPDNVIKKPGIVLIDMPKAMKKDRLAQLYVAIEMIKNGRCYDTRYKYGKERFIEPRVWVFTNTLPDFDLLVKDRWRLWEVNDKKELVEWTPPKMEFDDEEDPLEYGINDD